MTAAAAVTTTSITASAGSRRLARRAQKRARSSRRPVAVVPGDQQVGDQEAAEHEEDVDAEEAAGQPGSPFMEADHSEDGQRPEPRRGRAHGPRLRGFARFHTHAARIHRREMPADRRSMQVAVRTTCGQDDAAEELAFDVREFFRSVSRA